MTMAVLLRAGTIAVAPPGNARSSTLCALSLWALTECTAAAPMFWENLCAEATSSGFWGGAHWQRLWETQCASDLVGGGEDENGCIASAGSSWCESIGKWQLFCRRTDGLKPFSRAFREQFALFRAHSVNILWMAMGRDC